MTDPDDDAKPVLRTRKPTTDAVRLTIHQVSAALNGHRVTQNRMILAYDILGQRHRAELIEILRPLEKE